MNKKAFMVFVSQPMNGVEPEVVKKNMDQTRQLLEKMHPEDDVVFNIIDNYHHFSIADRLTENAWRSSEHLFRKWAEQILWYL